MSCDKIEVCTKSSLTKVFKHESQNTDFCLLFAPSSQESRFCVNSTNLGNDQLYVYNHVMNNAWYDKYTADEAAGWSVTSNRPWLFRFETDSEKHDEHFIEILAKSTKEMPNFALEYENVPESAKIPPPGVLKHNYLIPILGCAAPVILMGSWLYAVITLFGKPPAKPPSFNSNVDENYRNDNVENNVLDIE
ncbi:hypothetical protein TRFO_05701 [Tritrichomonas foetus]|uniref:Uncharacterized protein n=1 Tax=Tritrichomonas foetus TaxID=1144522 RepID=A0A1J4K9C9_9EUKA|nr:hypothetical protein TRFO_05701 [Tritrichomonas foetus]|eukprot:OHT06053.1 hypothetical protein TRFO_05701 [Tritrichomonas foetus]